MFDLNKYFTKAEFDSAPADDGFSIIPKGWYKAIIPANGIEEKQTNSGKTYVNIRFNITGDANGKPINRVHFQPLYIGQDYGEGANKMGATFIKQMATATGQPDLRGLEALMNRPMEVFINIEVDKTGQYDDKNRITGARPVRDVTAAKPAAGWR